jgi:hypothetical protein
MTLTTPPPVQDPRLCDVDDAVIKEAKRRARRRRWSYGGVLAVLLSAVAAFVAWYPTSPPPSAAAPAPAPAEGSLPAGGPSPEAQLVAHFGAAHWGWALAYSDGYVITYAGVMARPAATHPLSGPMGDARFVMRRLTVDGLADVRSGAVPPSAFLTDSTPEKGRWADPEFRPYDTPLGYVACLRDNPYPPSTGPMEQLPAAAQVLLRGTEQSYRFLDYQPFVQQDGTLPPVNKDAAPGTRHCYALTNDQAHALALMSTNPSVALAQDDPRAGCPPSHPGCSTSVGVVTLQDVHGADVTLLVHTALPDRVLVARGG